MAELVDALVSGTSDRKIVQVRALFWAPDRNLQKNLEAPVFSQFCIINNAQQPSIQLLFKICNFYMANFEYRQGFTVFG